MSVRPATAFERAVGLERSDPPRCGGVAVIWWGAMSWLSSAMQRLDRTLDRVSSQGVGSIQRARGGVNDLTAPGERKNGAR
jgi:hypothetical protein